MRYIKYFLLMFLFLFVFNLDVNAREYAYCYYNYAPNDSYFEIRKEGLCLFGCYEPATVVIQLVYDSQTMPSPTFASRIINSKNANFTNGYNDEFGSEIKYEPIRCLNTDHICFHSLPSVNIAQMRNSENKLVCPILYLLKSNYANGKPNYRISLTSNFSQSNNENFDSYVEITADMNYSKIYSETKEEKPDTPGESKIDCLYEYKNYGAASFASGFGEVGFSIYSDGTVKEIYANGVLNGYTYKFSGTISNTKKCPEYLKFKTDNVHNITTFSIGSSSNYDAIYVGKINNAEDNKKIIKYLSYRDSGSEYIKITKSGNSYQASLAKSTSDMKINITNIDEYTSIFSSSDDSNYPKYINCSDKTTCSFSTKLDGTAKRKYIYINAIYEMGQLGKDTYVDTCEDLLGSDFIGFLKKNVFNIIYIAVPIILILLTSFDFAKVVFVDDKDGIQASFKRFGKRCIAAILIYLIPTILIFVTNIFQADEVASCAKEFKKIAESNQ